MSAVIVTGLSARRGRQKRLMANLELPTAVSLELPGVAEDYALLPICVPYRGEGRSHAVNTTRCANSLTHELAFDSAEHACRPYTHDVCQETPAICMRVLTVTTAGDNLFIEASAENMVGA